MADAPKLFGKPGEQDDDVWEWGCEPRSAWVQVLDDGTVAAWVWLGSDDLFREEHPNESEAVRALERELTRLAAGLDAMGVPRG